MLSRQYRKATSFATYGGQRFRLTPAFLAMLNAAIREAEQSGKSSVAIETVAGFTPMTLPEMYYLRNIIVELHDAALRTEQGADI